MGVRLVVSEAAFEVIFRRILIRSFYICYQVTKDSKFFLCPSVLTLISTLLHPVYCISQLEVMRLSAYKLKFESYVFVPKVIYLDNFWFQIGLRYALGNIRVRSCIYTNTDIQVLGLLVREARSVFVAYRLHLHNYTISYTLFICVIYLARLEIKDCKQGPITWSHIVY